MPPRPPGVDNTSRRKWDKDQYEEKAKEREAKDVAAEETKMDARKRKRLERDPLHQGLIVQRANLRARDYQVDLASNLNKTQMVSVTMPLNQQGGYYCGVCDCTLKDSHSYLDHINGKWHQRALGMSMRVEQSTAQDVRGALEAASRKRREARGSEDLLDIIPGGYDKVEADEEGEEDEQGEGRRRGESEGEGDGGSGSGDGGDRARKDREVASTEGEEAGHGGSEEDEEEDDMAKLMGFGGFGSSKK